MTVKQKQCLLAYLGYYTGIIDDIWGEKSQQATIALQHAHSLEEDGIYGDQTHLAAKDDVANDRFAKTKETQSGTGEAPAAAENAATTEDSSATGTFWDEIEYFTREEFRCKCGGKYCDGFPAEPQEAMVRTVDEIRRRLGVPITISSGLRCKTHNAAVGGVSNSQHLCGIAADLHSSASPSKMKEVAEAVMGATGGIGLYSWGIHVDTRATKSRWNG